MGARRRLLGRGLAFKPDVVISNGDQLYWDLRTLRDFPPALEDHIKQHWWGRFGTFDRLWGSTAPGRAPDVNQFFGALRYGQLLEILMYDCRRFADYKGIHARVVPRWTEDWLKSRTLNEDTYHLMHSPSLPFGYSSGKLGDWYPDGIGLDGKLWLDRPKDAWQSGWHAQCQRITEMISAQKNRRAMIIDGDYQSQGQSC